MTKWILAIFVSFFVANANAANAAETAKLPGNVAVLIAKRHYEHPVRLLHPYLDVWHMKGPLAEKAALKVLGKRFANSSLCNTSKNADVVLLIEPQMFYNAQLRVFHAEMIVKAYAPLAEAPNTENFALQIKKQAQQQGDLSIKPDVAMEKAYTKAMEKVVKKLETDKTFLDLLNTNKTNAAENQCGALNDLPISTIYY
jgi:hypothetical protein